jgi:hypothetical protein
VISALSAVQTGVFAALNADTTLTGIVTGIFDDAPENQLLPYVTIGEATEQPFRMMGRDGSEIVLTVHAWSQSTGMKEVQTLIQRTVQVLDSIPLAITGKRLVYCNYEHGETMRDPDGITWHAFARFRCITQDGTA